MKGIIGVYRDIPLTDTAQNPQGTSHPHAARSVHCTCAARMHANPHTVCMYAGSNVPIKTCTLACLPAAKSGNRAGFLRNGKHTFGASAARDSICFYPVLTAFGGAQNLHLDMSRARDYFCFLDALCNNSMQYVLDLIHSRGPYIARCELVPSKKRTISVINGGGLGPIPKDIT
jgi:hypothetical protein